MGEKLCVFCVHCEWHESHDWGGDTGCDPSSMQCAKGHWHVFEGDMDEYRKKILKAEKCKDYKQADK